MNFVDASGLLLFVLCLALLPSIAKNSLGKKKPAYLKLIPVYIFLIFVQGVIGELDLFLQPWKRGKHSVVNTSLFIFIQFEYSIFAFLLSRFIEHRIVKRFLIFSCPLFITIAIMVWYFTPHIYKIFSTTTIIESLTLVPFCLYYFFQLLQKPPLFKLTDDPSFWITAGILFLFTIITPFYILDDYLINDRALEIIDYIGYYVVVLLFAKASFIKPKKVQIQAEVKFGLDAKDL